MATLTFAADHLSTNAFDVALTDVLKFLSK